MFSMRYRAFYPVGLIGLVSFLLIGLWPDSPTEDRFQSLLNRVSSGSSQEVDEYLRAIESYIQFQIKGLSPTPEEKSGRAIADLYFQLGSALLKRSDNLYLDAARESYLKAIQFYPSVRHGWPFYQLGAIFEQIGDRSAFEQAIRNYEQVSIFNSGVLSLQAGYRLSCIHRRINSSTDFLIASKPLYNYFRFASANLRDDLQPFLDSVFDGQDESLYLQAHLAQIRGDTHTAYHLLDQFLRQCPTDYSAQFYRDRFSGRPMKPLYPENGDLLSSCFASGSFRDGRLLMNNHHLRADLYVPHFQATRLSIEMTLENPNRERGTIFLTVNQQTIPYTLTPNQKIDPFSFRVDALQERNLINLNVMFEEVDRPSVHPRWIRFQSFAAHLVQRETP